MTAPLRVLQLASTSDIGGAERMILYLGAEMDPTKVAFHVACLVGGGDLIAKGTAAGWPCEHLRFSSPLDLRGVWRLIRFVRRHKIDVVQTHGLRADTVARWASKLAGARAVVSTIHSIDPWRQRRHSLLDRLTAGFVNRWVAVCEAAKTATVQREGFPADLIDVVHIGIPPREVSRERREAVRTQFGIGHDAPVIGVLANLREMKGHRDLVAALPALRAQHPDVVMLFAGKDTSNGAIEAEARAAGVADSIRFLGFVEDTPGLLQAMDIFCLPSHWEGLPVSIIEAMHSGLPIVTTPVGGIPELVRDRHEAMLVPPRNPEALAGALGELISNWALRASLSRAAMERAVSLFTASTMARRMEDSWRKALGAQKSGAQ